MTLVTDPARPITISELEIEKYLLFLEKFLGSKDIDRRIEQVERTVRFEQDQTVYLRYWVFPNAYFWLGIRDVRSLVLFGKWQTGNLPSRVQKVLEIAAKLHKLQGSMSDRVQDEFRTRILGSDFPAPTLYEIDTAGHFWQLGYEVRWCDPPEVPGERIPEFVAYSSTHEFEVECKSESMDSGRRILRPRFYRLVDRLAAPLSSEGFMGSIKLSVATEMPADAGWQVQLVEAVRKAVEEYSDHVELEDETFIDIDLHNVGDMLIPQENLDADIQAIKTPYSYIAVFCKQYGGTLVNPLIVKMESRSKDRFLKKVFDDLKEANRQFSGERAALICCFLPEVDSFDNLGTQSALSNMTFHFLRHHARPYVFAVSYTSESISMHAGSQITTSSPSITFENPYYDDDFGPRVSVYSGTC